MISPAAPFGLLQRTPPLASQPLNVIVIVADFGVVTSPAFESDLHATLTLDTVSSVLLPLVDVNGIGVGVMNSGSSACAGPAARPSAASAATQGTTSLRCLMLLLPSEPMDARRPSRQRPRYRLPPYIRGPALRHHAPQRGPSIAAGPAPGKPPSQDLHTRA